MGFIFSNQDVDKVRLRKGIRQRKWELREALSFLFKQPFFHEIELPGDGVHRPFEVSDALPTALEKPKDRFICTPDRTHNRIRSPRFAASGAQNKVGKGFLRTFAVNCARLGPIRCSISGTPNGHKTAGLGGWGLGAGVLSCFSWVFPACVVFPGASNVWLSDVLAQRGYLQSTLERLYVKAPVTIHGDLLPVLPRAFRSEEKAFKNHVRSIRGDLWWKCLTQNSNFLNPFLVMPSACCAWCVIKQCRRDTLRTTSTRSIAGLVSNTNRGTSLENSPTAKHWVRTVPSRLGGPLSAT